jgi:hypothetical protein
LYEFARKKICASLEIVYDQPMKLPLLKLSLLLCVLALFSTGASAAQISTCASDFSTCTVYEDGFVLNFPLCCGISGDVVLTDPGTSNVSDVFRIFNDIIDTGGGTGLGLTAFFYSADEHNLPTNFSANAVFITEGPEINGIARTNYTANGVVYHFVSGPVPEPATWGMLAIGALAMGVLVRRRRVV